MVTELNAQATGGCKNNEREGDEDGGVNREFLDVVRKRQLKYLGHLMTHDCLENRFSMTILRKGESEEDKESHLVPVALRIFMGTQRWQGCCGWRNVERDDV